MTVLPRQLVIAFANLFPAALLDPFGEMKGSHDRDLDFGRDPEQPERQALRLIEVGVSRGIAPKRLAHGIDEPVTARKGRERAEVDAGAMRPGRSAEHTYELQSLMRISYTVLFLKRYNTS